ncbi:MAG: CDP-alcohol phosphatidyltransferase family protein [Bacteroidales bacterium]|jgi:CDP-diacylglycerol--serine O-phosphatidyltransferase|nr:CDP-alcohol phosphatidyltransferase family protein [Bacteroidales bacterium]
MTNKTKPIRIAAPAFITLMNWFAGVMAIIFAMNGMLVEAALFIIAASVFDFFDGMVARLLNAQSELGVQLDSLADAVSFGLAPGFIIYRQLSENPEIAPVLTYIAFIPAAAAVLRLAIFNTKNHNEQDFFGLASPAFALFIAGITLSIELSSHQQLTDFFQSGTFWITCAVICSVLMLLPLRMFSLKFKHLKWKQNEYRYIFLLISFAIFPFLQIITLPLVIVLYILISVLYHINYKNIKTF